MNEHLHEECGLIHGFISYQKGIVDTDIGMTLIPGHAMESIWFMLHIYEYWKNQGCINRIIKALKDHLEFSWNYKYGGLFFAKNIKGDKVNWWNPEAKVWWVFTEAMYALLLAYELSREQRCIDWYWKLYEYAFNHFLNEKLEWKQNLDREGKEIPVVIPLEVNEPEKIRKDFFHLPPALILGIEILERNVRKTNF